MCYCWLVLWGRMAFQVLHHCDILILSPRSTLILHCLFHHLFGALHHPTSAFYSHHVLGTQSGATRATRRFFVGLQGLVDQIRRPQTSSLPLHLSKSRNNCLLLEVRASRDKENCCSFRMLRVVLWSFRYLCRLR